MVGHAAEIVSDECHGDFAGSKILAGYVRRYGLREGLHAYNGFGDPTSAYPDKVLLVAGYRIQ